MIDWWLIPKKSKKAEKISKNPKKKSKKKSMKLKKKELKNVKRKIEESKYLKKKKSKNLQMDDNPMDRLCYVNLDRPNQRRSNEPPMLCQFGLSMLRQMDDSPHSPPPPPPPREAQALAEGQ